MKNTTTKIGVLCIFLMLLWAVIVHAEIAASSEHELILVQRAERGEDKTALNAISYDIDSSTVWVTGYQDDKGTMKIGHIKPEGKDDRNAAVLSLYMKGKGTKAQAIFIDSDGSTGKLINARKSGKEVFVVDHEGNIEAESIELRNGATGKFRSGDNKIITVKDGIIVNIR